MYIHYSDNEMQIEWRIFRGLSKVGEDFSRSEAVVLLWNGRNRFVAGCTAIENGRDGRLLVAVPSGLPEGVYDLEGIWMKNGGRSVCRCRYIKAFGVTQTASAATYQGGATTGPVLSLRSSAATYGYDGLSAYELAVLKGKTVASEDEWLDGYVSGIEHAVTEAVARVKAAEVNAVDAISTAHAEAVGEIEEVWQRALDSLQPD